MNFDNVKVVFNHQKHRTPLGHIRLAWHDHKFPSSGFAVAVLAVIENKALLETPACVTIMGDSFASLSTLEEDASRVVEVSVTYVGARDGCVGLFVPNKRVKDMLGKYGLADEYKCHLPDVSASWKTMEEQGRNLETEDIEMVLQKLPEEQYTVVKDHILKEQDRSRSMLDEMEKHKRQSTNLGEAVGLLSDYLSSMIQSRIALEQGSNSDMAKKRRRDFEMMKEKGVFQGQCSDMEAMREMVEYCRECFPDSSKAETQIVERFCNMFDERFPELSKQLQRKEPSIATVDAAFDLIRREMRNKEVSGLSKERKGIDNRLRAFQTAKEQYDILSDRNTNTKKSSSEQNVNMDPTFEQFLQQMGMSNAYEKRQDEQPPAKRARTHVSDENGDDDNFLRYAISKEREYENRQKRFKSYQQEYKDHRRKRDEADKRQLRELIDFLPSLKKMAAHFEETNKRSETVSNDARESKVPSSSPMDTQPDIPQEKTVDASKLETPQVYFDL